MKLPDKLKNFTPYPPMSASPCVRLDGNESCYALPGELMEELLCDLRGVALNRYPDPAAAEVCALAEAFWGAPSGSAVAGNGSDELISIALGALLPRGGRLLVCDPDFSMYRFYAALNELHCLGLARPDGLPDINEIAQKAQSADAVILSNPCNPTGQGIVIEEMLRLLDKLSCPVILDEAYMDFWQDGKHSAMPYIERYNNLIIMKTCSKNLAAAGIRLGFAFAGNELSTILRTVKSPYNVSAVTQAIGCALLRQTDWLRENTRRIVSLKQALFERLSEWGKTVSGCAVTDTVANFVLLSLPGAEKLYKTLAQQGVLVRLTGGVLRITAGTEDETNALMNALSAREG